MAIKIQNGRHVLHLIINSCNSYAHDHKIMIFFTLVHSDIGLKINITSWNKIFRMTGKIQDGRHKNINLFKNLAKIRHFE